MTSSEIEPATSGLWHSASTTYATACRMLLHLLVSAAVSMGSRVCSGRSCGDCPRNASDCFRKLCVTADGFQRGLLTANRQMPGPVIQVRRQSLTGTSWNKQSEPNKAFVRWRQFVKIYSYKWECEQKFIFRRVILWLNTACVQHSRFFLLC
jgi:hypothetical protein